MIAIRRFVCARRAEAPRHGDSVWRAKIRRDAQASL
jgi:hypothetical protein